MLWLSCDRRVKWRRVSSSPTSGNGSSLRRYASGSLASGTSGAGKRMPRRPFTPISKIRGSVTGHLRQHMDKEIDLFAAVHLGHRVQAAIFHPGEIASQIVAAEDAFGQQGGVDLRRRFGAAHRKFVEEGRLRPDQ